MHIFKKFYTYLFISIFVFILIPNQTNADEIIPLPEAGTIIDGRTVVPIRAIFEELGASVNWDQKNQMVTASKDNKKITLKIGSKKTTVNDKTVIIDVPAKIIQGKTYVPLRFISESLGAEVKWNSNDRSALINTSGKHIIVRTLPPMISETKAGEYILDDLKRDGFTGLEIKFIYLDDDVSGLYRAKVGPKGSPYGYHFLYVDPYYGTVFAEYEPSDKDEWMYGYTKDDLKYYK